MKRHLEKNLDNSKCLCANGTVERDEQDRWILMGVTVQIKYRKM